MLRAYGAWVDCYPISQTGLSSQRVAWGGGSEQTDGTNSTSGHRGLTCGADPVLLLSSGMLEYEPAKRFSIRQIRQHRCVAGPLTLGLLAAAGAVVWGYLNTKRKPVS